MNNEDNSMKMRDAIEWVLRSSITGGNHKKMSSDERIISVHP